MMLADDPHSWRIGFSKIFLEIAPFVFAEQLIRLGSGAMRKMVSEIERVRQLHSDQAEKDGGKEIERAYTTKEKMTVAIAGGANRITSGSFRRVAAAIPALASARNPRDELPSVPRKGR
jgi:hypothetical protein